MPGTGPVHRLCLLVALAVASTLGHAPLVLADVTLDQQYPPRYSLGTGYAWADIDGAATAAPYRTGTGSPVFKAEAEVYPRRHRFHLEFSTEEKDDFYLDTGYAYRDVILSRLILREVVHNLDHYRFPDGDPAPERRYSDRDPSGTYKTDTMIQDFFLRLKTPVYPLHVYGRYFRHESEGEVQQRFLIGDFNDMSVTSTGRDTDLTTEELLIGTNGHFGFIEVDYSHGEKSFAAGGEKVLEDPYPPTAGRPGDTYPHNLEAETRSSADFVKVHSAYTGRVTASATLGRIRQANEYSRARREIVTGTGQFSYIAAERLSFFLRLHYREVDEEAPAFTVLRGLDNELTYGVRRPLDLRQREAVLDVRTVPLRGLRLTGTYSVTTKERLHRDEWPLLDKDTTARTLSLRLNGVFLKGLAVRTLCRYRTFENPVYNTEPDTSREISIHATYSPLPWLWTILAYGLSDDSRDRLRFSDPASEGGRRDRTTHNVLGMVTVAPGRGTSLTVGGGYYRNNLEQTLRYSTFAGDGSLDPGPPLTTEGEPYSDETVLYFIGLKHRIDDRTGISVDLAHTLSRGKFETSGPLTEDIGSFTALKATETALSLKGSYEALRDLDIETLLGLTDYNDMIEDYRDGTLYRLVLFIVKRW